MTRSLSGVLCALLVGCSGALKPLGSAPDDYGQYRRLRASETFEQRLSAGSTYLRDFPNGHWHAEVEAWFEHAEAVYLERFWDDRARLAQYLRLAPDGPRASLVVSRIAALDAAQNALIERQKADLAAAHETERRFVAAEAQRNELIASYEKWLARLAAIRSFGQPLSALDAGLLHEIQETSPAAVCDAASCVKSLTLPFSIVDSGQWVERRARLEIVLELQAGTLASASIRGVKLFEYIAEALHKRALHDDNPQARREGMASLVQISSRTLDLALPRPSCDADPVPPALLVRACQGARLEMRPAQSDEEADTVEIAPAPPLHG